jgi:hypothetical protein
MLRELTLSQVATVTGRTNELGAVEELLVVYAFHVGFEDHLWASATVRQIMFRNNITNKLKKHQIHPEGGQPPRTANRPAGGWSPKRRIIITL